MNLDFCSRFATFGGRVCAVSALGPAYIWPHTVDGADLNVLTACD